MYPFFPNKSQELFKRSAGEDVLNEVRTVQT